MSSLKNLTWLPQGVHRARVGSDPRLPAELCDIIIDYLNDPHTLASCALVCRGWTPATRMHQFFTLVLHRFPERRTGKLSLLCDPSSTAPTYVRRLVITEGRGQPHNPYWLSRALPKMRIHDLGTLEHLMLANLVLEHFVSEPLMLHALCARAATVAIYRPELFELPPLLTLCQACASMEELVLNAGRSPWTVTRVGEHVAVDATSFALPQNLRTLEIQGYMWPFMEVLAMRFHPRPQLRSLYISSLFGGCMPSVFSLLKWCGAELKELTLLFEDPRTRPEDYVHPETSLIARGGLVHNTALRTLNLACEATFAVGILQTIASPAIQTVSIYTAPSSARNFCSPELAALFSGYGAVLPRTRLRILGSEDFVQPLLMMRYKIYSGLAGLRSEGRLEFERVGGHSMEPDTPLLFGAKWEVPFPTKTDFAVHL